MSALATRPPADALVGELYGRYKTLALAAGAALLLDEPRDALAAETRELLRDAYAALGEHPERRPQLEACIEAADRLYVLLASGGHDVEAVRATHKHLRREVWKVVPCEYVPCCASPGHAHEREGESNG